MKEKVTCPVGLQAIIGKVAEIMNENIGRLTIDLCLFSGMQSGSPFLCVYVHDERKNSRKKCKSYMLHDDKNQYFSQKDNDANWRKMLKFIERVRL